MQLENYLLYLEKTIDLYPNKVKRYLIKEFIKGNIATKEESKFEQLCIDGTETVNISDSKNNLTEQIVTCIKCNKNARLLFEKWEFTKDYKYSVIFTCDNFIKLLDKVVTIVPLENCCENEYVYESFGTPVAYHTSNYSFLKFNLIFATWHPLTQEEFLNKYPFLIVLHKDKELIEFRFDALKKVFLSDKREQSIYANFIANMIEYFNQHFNCALSPLNIDFMVNVCKSDTTVKLIAQYMKLPSGGSAQLEVGNNQEYVLPFIGELRSLLSDSESELVKVPVFRGAIEQFMFEMEELSDYPWIELLWEDEVKTRSKRIKLIFNYMNNSYCLIQHYYSNVLIGMERMNYVIEYINDHRNDNEMQIE